MFITITTSGLLVNDGEKPNPRECEMFSHQVEWTVDPILLSDEHIEWYLTGDVPKGVEIDKDSGLISGKVKMFIDQELDSDLYHPVEPIEFDGSNYNNVGMLIADTYTFNFTINKKTKIEELPTIFTEEISTSDVSIMVVKNNNIFNTLFMRAYLDSTDSYPVSSLLINMGELTVSVLDERRHMTIGDKKYYIEDIDELLNDHPGPFGKCE